MALIHTEGDPMVVVSDTGTVLVILNPTEGLRFRSDEAYNRWVEALDRAALHAFAAEARRNIPQLPLEQSA